MPLYGYEWTSRAPVDVTYPPEEPRRGPPDSAAARERVVDHRSVLLPAETSNIVRWSEVDGRIEALYEFVRDRKGFVHPHHQTWWLTGDELEANVEAASSWDVYLERDASQYHKRLAGGHRIGLIGGSDEHRRNPGLSGALTGIWAEELTRDCVMEALRSHRCFATSGRRVVLDFRAGDRPMGSVLRAGETCFGIGVDSPIAVRTVQLIRNGGVLREWDAKGGKKFEVGFGVTATIGEGSFYLRIRLEGEHYTPDDLPSTLQQALGPFAWSSPIWLVP